MSSAKLSDQAARDRAATELGTNFFVEAAAGTGKTTALVRRILSIVAEQRARLTAVVAITFTEKAAGELKLRLREALEKQLTGDRLAQALADLERAHITTIHSFCAWVLRERPVEAAVDPQFAVADELQRQIVFEEAWSEWFEQQLAGNPPALRRALLCEQNLEKLPELAELLIAHRARLTESKWPDRVPLDLAGTLDALRAAAPTLTHCLKHCVSPGENFAQQTRALLDVVPSLDHASPDRQLALLAQLDLKQPRATAHFDSAAAFREMKEAVKDLQPLLAEFTAAAGHNLLLDLVEWLWGFVDYFQQAKHRRALLDFDDLLLKTRDLLRRDAAVRRELQQRCAFLLVDEFQDTDPVQSEIVRILGEGPPGKLFLVGDPKQSIYAFRRADIEMYAETKRRFAGEPLVFNQNFRSLSTILDWVNAVFGRILVKSTDGDYQPEYIELVAAPQLRSVPPAVTVLRPKEFPAKQSIDETRRLEAAAVAQHVRDGVAAGRWRYGDVALLFRSFTAAETYAEIFQEQAVPLRVIGGRGYYQRQEIQTLSSLLCCLDNPADQLHLIAVLRSPLFGWTDEQIFLAAESTGLDYTTNANPTFALLHDLHRVRHAGSVPGYVAQVFAQTKICEAFLASQPDGVPCVANLLKALDLARQLEAVGVRSLRAFVRRLRETVLGGIEEEPSPASEESEDVVRFLSMHKSKGLQFPVVILPDLPGQARDSGAKLLFDRAGGRCELRFGGWRTVGFAGGKETQEKREAAEEIRLLYVAATRAEKRLVIPWFVEKGGRLTTLRDGFEPVAGELVEVDFGAGRAAAELPDPGKPAASRSTLADRTQWATDRAALVARAGQAAVRLRPSGLAHEDEPVAALAEAGVRKPRQEAVELGVVVHEVLERATTAQQARALVAQSGLTEDQQRSAREMAERLFASALWRRVQQAGEVHREVPFALAAMDGKIDLLFREGDRWTLVDYKTDQQPDATRYREQLAAYARALAETAGIRVTERLLFFLATGDVVDLNS